ncbi:hypothetical protein [Aeromonas enteropelogenes]|uniref:hypothetical protein n=1 Tax=Aeromonas enteropelogenes TaxID=29489 RepID=UPI003BA221B9
MYWIDNGTGVTTMPEIPPTASSVPMWFTEGGPGEEPTIPGAAEWNMLQAELLNVLYDADMEPAKAELNQIAKAIRTIAQGEVADGGFLPSTDYTPRPDSLRGNVPAIQNKDMDTCLPGEFGLYETSSCAHSPTGAGNWFYCETKSINYDGSLIQLAWPFAGVGVLAWRNWRKSTEDWDDNWREAYDTGNKLTLGDIGGLPPVGAVLFFEDGSINPAAIYPGTTWARVAANQNIRGAVEGEAGGLTGGSDSAALGVEHMPPHAHTVNDHVHYVPPHAHYLFNSGYNNYGTPINGASSGPVASGGISRSTTDRDDYLLMAGVGGNWVGISSSAGETNTGGAAPATNVQGAGAAFSVLNAFYKLHIWKRLS